jgi:hypothetical protein
LSSSTASKLDALIGLHEAKRVVRKISSGEGAVHAVLFYGIAGSGKEELASALAQYWLCRNPDPASGADGTCQPCGAFERKTNPDLLRLIPSGASSIIGIKHFHERDPHKDEDPLPLMPFMRTGPIMSRHKVALISDAHRMNGDASNSLLKILEEPQPHTKLVLTTDSVGGIAPTILSRCLAVACSLPSEADLRSHFSDATDDDVLLAEGAPGRMSAVLANAEPYRAVVRFARDLRTKRKPEALATADQLRGIADKIGSARGLNARAANAETLSVLATVLTRDPACPPGLAQAAIEAHRRVLGNGNPTIVLDALFAQALPD